MLVMGHAKGTRMSVLDMHMPLGKGRQGSSGHVRGCQSVFAPCLQTHTPLLRAPLPRGAAETLATPSSLAPGAHTPRLHAPHSPVQARCKIRVICARPYHALFMHNMLIRPTPEELEQFGEPDFVIYNSGGCSV